MLAAPGLGWVFFVAGFALHTSRQRGAAQRGAETIPRSAALL
jgi:hypothetical protein